MLLEGNSVRTISRRITLREMHEYTSTSARVAEDILTPDGAVLVPKNAELAKFGPSMKIFEQNLRRWNILSIPITIDNTINTAELENILKNAKEQASSVDAQLAHETIKQIKNVYERIEDGICDQEDISILAAQGRTVAEEVSQAPQLMLCLGKVRSWDEYTYVHSLNVALLSGFIARRIFPDNPKIAENVSVGAILHDLGKAHIPKEILNKPARLTDEEFTIIKKHAIYGEELAKTNGINNISALAVIRCHHERYNGSGYPDGLSKDNIQMEARIAAVADVFDALTTIRVYKEQMESHVAISLMVESMSDFFDPIVMRALLVSIGFFPPGTGAELSDGSFGVVVGSSGNDLMRPQVLLHVDNMGRKVDGLKIVDLSKSENLYVRRPMRDVGKVAF